MEQEASLDRNQAIRIIFCDEKEKPVKISLRAVEQYIVQYTMKIQIYPQKRIKCG